MRFSGKLRSYETLHIDFCFTATESDRKHKRTKLGSIFIFGDGRSENIDSVEFSWDLKARRAFVVRVQCGRIKERSRYGNLDEMQMVPRVPNAKLRP